MNWDYWMALTFALACLIAITIYFALFPYSSIINNPDYNCYKIVYDDSNMFVEKDGKNVPIIADQFRNGKLFQEEDKNSLYSQVEYDLYWCGILWKGV